MVRFVIWGELSWGRIVVNNEGGGRKRTRQWGMRRENDGIGRLERSRDFEDLRNISLVVFYRLQVTERTWFVCFQSTVPHNELIRLDSSALIGSRLKKSPLLIAGVDVEE